MCTGEARGSIEVPLSAMSSWSWEAHAGAIHVDAGDGGRRLASTTSTSLLSPLGWERSCAMGSLEESVCAFALVGKTELGSGG
jgi:hypothetical protein